MPTFSPTSTTSSHASDTSRNRFLLFVAGLGGLLYGVDVGIIGGALPYLEATSGLNAGQLSIIVAAVLLGSVISTLFAGVLADWMGRRLLMIVSGLTFVISIPMIAIAHGYSPLFFGRLLQGISGGLIGVVVPLYLAECLSASNRGKGTAVFQWLLTLGICSAAIIGIYYSYRVEAISHAGDTSAIFAFKDQAWRRIFWVSLPPGALFVLGAMFVAESPRWLYLKGKKEQALASLKRLRSPEQAEIEFAEMEEIAASAKAKSDDSASAVKESLLRRKYVIPFLLACIILFCNTATGVNSIIGYNTSILLQSGLSDLQAHWGYVLFTFINFLMTMIGMALVDRKGRKFLFVLGTSGIIVSLVGTALLFRSTEKLNRECRGAVQALVAADQTLALPFNAGKAKELLESAGFQGDEIQTDRSSLAVIYSYGDYTAATSFVRSDDPSAPTIKITRESCVPSNKVEAFFKNPFGNLEAARTAPLRIDRATVGQTPSTRHGWTVAIAIYLFMSFFAIGPGVCVWIALSELMPTRIRSNGMSIALVINQLVSTVLAGIFLPAVSKYGYSTMFFLFAGFTVIYFFVTTFFLPETKGKTLEEIELYFETGKEGSQA